MKRILILFAVLLIVTCMLCACGEESNQGSATDAASNQQNQMQTLDLSSLFGQDSSADDAAAPILGGSLESDAAQSDPSAVQTSCDLDELLSRINVMFDLGASREITDPSRYYGISADDVTQFCAQKPMQSDRYEEIVLCEVKSSDAASRVENLLNRRLDAVLNTVRSYDQDALGVVERCEVVTSGRYVYLVISEEYDAICELIASSID